MFLPRDMSDDEKTLAAQVARELLAQTPPQTSHERQVLRHRAEEIAAEMIWAARGEAAPDDDEWDEETLGPDPLRSTLAEKSLAQANTEVWLEALEDDLAEQEARHRANVEYRRRQIEDNQPPQP
jgi:malic enzyme